MEDPERLEKDFRTEQEPSLNSLIRKNTIYVALERTLVPVVNFLITVYVIRTLSVDEYGIYKLLLAVMSYVALFSSLGLPNVVRRFVPEFFQKKEMGKLKALVKKGLLWRMLLCSAIVALIIVFAEPLGRLFKVHQVLQYFAVFSVGIIFYLGSSLLSSTLISVFRHKMYMVIQMIYVVFRGGLLYFLLSQGYGLVGLLISESVSYVLLSGLLFLSYRRFLSSYAVKEESDLPLKRLFRFGGFSLMNEAGAEILSVTTDYFIISAFLGPVQVGIYGFANRIMALASRFLPQSMFVKIIRPAFYMKYVQNEDPTETNRMYNLLTKLIAFFAIPMMFAIIVLGDKIIVYIFDPKYLKSLTILWIVAGFHALDSFLDPISIVLESKEKVQILFYSKIFAVYNLIGDLLVVKPFGIIGIALVTSSAVLFKNMFCYFFARKYVHVKLEYRGVFIVGLNALIMAIVLFLLRSQIQNLFTLALVVLAGGAAYLALSFVNKAFSGTERKVMNRILPKPVFVF